MTNVSHTPGPWMAGQSITAARPDRPDGSYDRITIAQRVNRSADAHLIAAAPDLLAIVRHLVELFDAGADCVYRDSITMGDDDTTIEQYCRAAITKAEGKVSS